MKNILVVGATGKTGNSICNELESKNIKYSVFVRQESANKILSEKAEIIKGNVRNIIDLENVFSNSNFTDIIISLGSRQLKNTNIRSEGTKNIIDAIKKNKLVVNIHIVSALGVNESWEQLNWSGKLMCNLLLNSIIKDHSVQENYLIESGLPYHIIRPVGLKDKIATGSVLVKNEGVMPCNYIQRTDVAKFIIDSLLENKTGFSSICEKK